MLSLINVTIWSDMAELMIIGSVADPKIIEVVAKLADKGIHCSVLSADAVNELQTREDDMLTRMRELEVHVREMRWDWDMPELHKNSGRPVPKQKGKNKHKSQTFRGLKK